MYMAKFNNRTLTITNNESSECMHVVTSKEGGKKREPITFRAKLFVRKIRNMNSSCRKKAFKKLVRVCRSEMTGSGER